MSYCEGDTIVMRRMFLGDFMWWFYDETEKKKQVKKNLSREGTFAQTFMKIMTYY